MIHGYGGNSEEVLGLAVDLASRLELRLLVFTLPGHGFPASEPLTRQAALLSLKSAVTALENPDFFIGHSLGARLGLAAGLPHGGPALHARLDRLRREQTGTVANPESTPG